MGSFHLGFTSVSAGNLAQHVGSGDAAPNRRQLEDLLGLAPGAFRYLNQVHSPDVVDAESEDASPTGDAWISTDGSQPVAIMVADCLPVLFAATGEDGEPMSAAAHAGRHGLLGGVLENSVQALRQHGAHHITAWIGPGACSDCYEVPQDMFNELTVGRPALAATTRWSTPALDLRSEARAVLEALDVTVLDVSGCTIEDPALFSHRGTQTADKPEGRIAGLIWAAE